MKKVLIVEDSIDIHEMLKEILLSNGYEPLSAFSGTEAMLVLERETPDLVLLDLMLPGKSGEEVLSEFENKTQIPVIVLTAVSDKHTIVSLLRKGASDYLVKPFDYDELLARIEVQFRKLEQPGNTGEEKLQYKDITLNLNTFEVFVAKQPVSFAKREFLILKLLIENPQRVFSKEVLYEKVWGEPYYGDENTIHVHISNIRKKLHKINPQETYLETVWGIGFKLGSET